MNQQQYRERITQRNKADVMEASAQKSLGSLPNPTHLPRLAPLEGLLSYKRRETTDTCLSNTKTTAITQPKLSMRVNRRGHVTFVARNKLFLI
jgi:hypothetical protein